MATVGNGWPVIDVRTNQTADTGYTVTVYLRIPDELATEIDGGCCCEYCKAHPMETPRWDTLAVCDSRTDHSWSVHYPDPRPITPIERKAIEARRSARTRV
jgi:hypothetical protein